MNKVMTMQHEGFSDGSCSTHVTTLGDSFSTSEQLPKGEQRICVVNKTDINLGSRDNVTLLVLDDGK